MSTAAVDIYCHACSRIYPGADYSAEYNDEEERICPECSSEFVEIREAQVASSVSTDASTRSGVGQSVSGNSISADAGPASASTTTSTRRVFTTPDGLNMELHITTAMVPPEVYEMLSRNGSSGMSMMFQMDNGSLVSAGNMRNFMADDNFDALLDRLAQAYRPPIHPTPQHVIDELPHRLVVPANSQPPDADEVQHATCRPGEPCPVCHDEFQANTHVVELPCQHCFHHDCILPWLQEHNTCPVCRFKLAGDDAASPSPARHRNPPTFPNRTPGLPRASDPSPYLGMPTLVTESDSDDEADGDDNDLPGLIRNHNPQASTEGSPTTTTTTPTSGSSSPPLYQLRAAPGMGSSPHPVRTSPGSSVVRTAPYNRLDDAVEGSQDPRRDVASSSRPASASMRLAGSSLAADLNSLVVRHQELRREAAEARQVTTALQQQLDSLLQRHAGVPAAAAEADRQASAAMQQLERMQQFLGAHTGGDGRSRERRLATAVTESAVSLPRAPVVQQRPMRDVSGMSDDGNATRALELLRSIADRFPEDRDSTANRRQTATTSISAAQQPTSAAAGATAGAGVATNRGAADVDTARLLGVSEAEVRAVANQESVITRRGGAAPEVAAAPAPVDAAVASVGHEHVVVALEGVPVAPATEVVAVAPVQLPVVLRLLGGVLRWAFRGVRGLFRLF